MHDVSTSHVNRLGGLSSCRDNTEHVLFYAMQNAGWAADPDVAVLLFCQSLKSPACLEAGAQEI